MQLQPLRGPPCVQAVELQPDDGFEKYMYLSQFLSGDEALQAARKGLDVLQRQLDGMVRAQHCILHNTANSDKQVVKCFHNLWPSNGCNGKLALKCIGQHVASHSAGAQC